MRRTGVRPSRRATSRWSPSIGRFALHAWRRAMAWSRWPCSFHAGSNIGDLAGMRTYSVSAGMTLSSHARWTYWRGAGSAGGVGREVAVAGHQAYIAADLDVESAPLSQSRDD